MGGIYLIQGDGQLVEMPETAYDSEALLQELLATYPSLLAGDQINTAAPRRWLLISREVPLASEEGGVGRWSIDHVFLDQDAVPTLVEVKRSTDTRIRREVVGQMLDYAANAVVYWPVEKMQAQFEQRCADEGRDPVNVFEECLGRDIDPVAFWQQAKVNLQAGKVRMVFVADKIPTELLRIVEFLNEQMDPAQVLAVEVRQYLGQGQRAMVPRVLGQTAEAQQRKSAPRSPGRQWDAEAFLHALQESNTAEVVTAFRRILDWTNDRGLDLHWGRGARNGSFYPSIRYAGGQCRPVGVFTSGHVETYFDGMKSHSPFNDESKLREFWIRLNQIDGVSLAEERLGGWSMFPLALLAPEESMRQFLATLDWIAEEVTALRP